MSVYFITCRQTATVKIGNSLEPHARIKELQTAHPFELKLEAMLPGDYDEEGDLHYRFASVRMKGEWFAITPEIEALIAANPPPASPKRVRISRAKPMRPPVKFGETARQYEQRLRDERLAKEREAGRLWLEAQAKTGRIHFPFRAKETARASSANCSTQSRR